MSQAELINEGLSLMVFGMGFVFIFLTLLVFATGLMSKVVQTIAPEDAAPAPRKAAASITGAADPAADPVLLAVINDAISQHRARRKS
ncbi:OadG family protein [Sansalvadorimonas verongulae]|uniref:OadG family protein n=1 Tax=Sansalvadorimonas verongulae TaxID=2172824 RepID=UPI0012BB5068|nr:OadG family transporter subunit [Sansalvadorimonas verongulae]MTI13436.1 oxaloacetate decarboxylase [Sansalvadorimonas verongulae]